MTQEQCQIVVELRKMPLHAATSYELSSRIGRPILNVSHDLRRMLAEGHVVAVNGYWQLQEQRPLWE